MLPAERRSMLQSEHGRNRPVFHIPQFFSLKNCMFASTRKRMIRLHSLNSFPLYMQPSFDRLGFPLPVFLNLSWVKWHYWTVFFMWNEEKLVLKQYTFKLIGYKNICFIQFGSKQNQMSINDTTWWKEVQRLSLWVEDNFFNRYIGCSKIILPHHEFIMF